MLALEAIRLNRESLEELNQLHLQSLKSNGEDGNTCLNYQHFLSHYYNLTDEQIIQILINRGVKIEDAEEFLQKKEKA